MTDDTGMLDSIHYTITEIERHALGGTRTNQLDGLAVSGDALTRYWSPIRQARLNAGAPIPTGQLWP